jgi:glycosyltransferase 2 family protein
MKNITIINKNNLILCGKFLFSLIAIIYIYSKIDISEIQKYIVGVNWYYIIIVYLLLHLSQVFSVLRMRYYFGNLGVTWKFKQYLSTYYIGMFLNTILPGGIGGDAYRLVVLDEKTHLTKKAIFKRLISERASGLYILLMMTCVMMPFSNLYFVINNSIMLLILIIAIISLGYFISVRYLLTENKKRAIGAMKYSFFVQLTSVISAYFILMSFAHSSPSGIIVFDYLVIFNFSCIASILPISIGGVGIREMMFVMAAKFIPIDSELGVTMSLFYFLIYLMVAITAWIHFVRKKQ